MMLQQEDAFDWESFLSPLDDRVSKVFYSPDVAWTTNVKPSRTCLSYIVGSHLFENGEQFEQNKAAKLKQKEFQVQDHLKPDERPYMKNEDDTKVIRIENDVKKSISCQFDHANVSVIVSEEAISKPAELKSEKLKDEDDTKARRIEQGVRQSASSQFDHANVSEIVNEKKVGKVAINEPVKLKAVEKKENVSQVQGNLKDADRPFMEEEEDIKVTRVVEGIKQSTSSYFDHANIKEIGKKRKIASEEAINDPEKVKVMFADKTAGDKELSRHKQLFQDYRKLQEEKGQHQKSAGQWNEQCLEKYVAESNLVFCHSVVQKKDCMSDNLKQETKEFVIKASSFILPEKFVFSEESLCLKNLNLFSRGVKECLINEACTRIIIDSMFEPVCRELGLQVRMNHRIKKSKDKDECVCMPASESDYQIKFKDVPLAMIEAKQIPELKRKNFSQLFIQLLNHQLRQPALPYLGILTDGFRFVFLILNGSKLHVECSNSAKITDYFSPKSKDKTKQLLVFNVCTWADLFHVLNKFRNFVISVKEEINNLFDL